ncbi:MAG: hypothetical protein PUC40_07500 [Lachnospiraceae bacterium]|nr:hypothetical protein [Lachnospiraceae bacterium]MDD6380898.1 hypothetical protein [Lachnospiraceae bacterium]
MSRKRKVTLEYLSAGKAIDQYGNETKESFAAVPESLLLSLSFQQLKNRQKLLVIYCLAKTYGHVKPCDDKSHPAYNLFKDRSDAFYISFDDVTSRYHLYSRKATADFYGDLKELEDHGLIKKLWSGRGHKVKSVYCFSRDWIEWIPEPP